MNVNLGACYHPRHHLVKDEVLQQLGRQDCPYTTTRTYGGRCHLLFWGAHVERLAQSARVMQAAGKWEGAEDNLAPEQLHRLIQPSLEVALRQATFHLDSATTHELSVTILLPGPSTSKRPADASPHKEQLSIAAQRIENSKLASQKRDSKRNESASYDLDSVRIVRPDQQAASLTPDALSENDLAKREMRKGRGAKIEGEVKACVYVSKYEAPTGGSMPQGTTVAVMGPGRQMPAAKDSSWAIDRRPLEAPKPPDVGEVLLSNDGEALLEGLLTNFFVVRRRTGGANRASSKTDAETVLLDAETSPLEQHMLSGDTPRRDTEGAKKADDAKETEGAGPVESGKDGEGYAKKNRWNGLVVQTAALEEGVLPGVIRRAVLSLCEAWGVEISLEAPRLSDRSTWLEAFVTSSVRIVQPVVSVRWRQGWRPAESRPLPGHVAASDWREHRLPADSPFCRALWEALLSEERLRLDGSSMDIVNLCGKS
ncbi:hypothetical protein KFL_000130510 [Klebsormidium nitens]|uniref:Uncharacterized protein n=1 Tax=Klebsormidium nitens TaxID=105231 RepID=A0A1Y1HRK4_KLENI|nr:hypothetical protein KFL_000130510 [Klebsormidium nitens]|eukprot:GAQ78468.1 hypothetical protein KFL_000130510 [Klebsormidium nitens]